MVFWPAAFVFQFAKYVRNNILLSFSYKFPLIGNNPFSLSLFISTSSLFDI